MGRRDGSNFIFLHTIKFAAGRSEVGNRKNGNYE
jgi:hypothetical protein